MTSKMAYEVVRHSGDVVIPKWPTRSYAIRRRHSDAILRSSNGLQKDLVGHTPFCDAISRMRNGLRKDLVGHTPFGDAIFEIAKWPPENDLVGHTPFREVKMTS